VKKGHWSPSTLPLILAAVIVVGTLVVVLGVLPLADCSLCWGEGRVFYQYGDLSSGTRPSPEKPEPIRSMRCNLCGGKGRRTVFGNWKHSKNVPLLFEDDREEKDATPDQVDVLLPRQ
jgi:hypothetical protein